MLKWLRFSKKNTKKRILKNTKNAHIIRKNQNIENRASTCFKLDQIRSRAKNSWICDFWIFHFYGFYGHFSCFLKCVFLCFFAFFSKISAILTPRTMKFGHIKYFCTKKWHKKKFRKISIFRAFFRCSFYTQIQKWCVCSRFPQSLNIRAAWNLEFKSKLDQLEKKWKPFFKIRIFTPI